MSALRIAMLTHSVNPRGGVVHAMELCAALNRLGHAVTLHAPDTSGQGFFRAGEYHQAAFACAPAKADVYEMVEQRVTDYVGYFSHGPSFDIYHAQDSISGNALATLTERGLIPGYLRTVHHLDQFQDARLEDLQTRSVMAADRVLCVSRLWQRCLFEKHTMAATLVGSGVDGRRFTPHASSQDEALRRQLGIRAGAKVLLASGGIEPRKNTTATLQAFAQLHTSLPETQLVLAGGASLLDHSEYTATFWQLAKQTGLQFGHGGDVILAPRVADGAMPSLFRIANALVFPSVKEGFGLVVLEALACGTPIVLARIAPFTEYMPGNACVWVDPQDIRDLRNGMLRVLEPELAATLRRRGPATAAQFSWDECARTHEKVYQSWLRCSQPDFQGAIHA